MIGSSSAAGVGCGERLSLTGPEETLEKDHGRLERRYWITPNLDSIKRAERWPCLSSVGMVESERTIAGQTSRESAVLQSAGSQGTTRRNSVLPCAATGRSRTTSTGCSTSPFREDESRIRKDNAPENVAMLRHVALNLLKADKTTRHPSPQRESRLE